MSLLSKKILVERDVETRMRDGAILRADVYRPDVDERLPVLLQRTPYGKGFSQTSYALMAAERGYAVVIQDTRGRWASEGVNYPLVSEMDDGQDTVSWAAGQPWSNGRVGMFGASYVGYTQWAAATAQRAAVSQRGAVTQPPALQAIAPAFTFCDPYSMVYAGGALALGAAVAWSLLSIAQMDLARYPGSPQEKAALLGQFVTTVDGMASGRTFRQMPLGNIPLIGEGGIHPLFQDVLSHPTPDERWQRVVCRYDRIAVPALHIGGWYDTFISNTLRDFSGVRDQAATETARAAQKLVVGPWTHAAFEGLNGEVDFGLQASWMLVLPDEIHLRWYDYWLKDIPNGILDEPPVRLFVMGDNRWRTEEEWPLSRARPTSYYLHSRGSANTLHGDGSLSLEAPSGDPPDRFLYDPHDPVPTRGGGLLGWQAALPPGAFDQRSIEERLDVLVYTSPTLAEDLEVTGQVQVRLWAASTAPDTDFTAKLVDVSPEGYARNLLDGILRARYRQGPDSPSLLVPGEAYEFTIDLGPTSNVFKAGHCIRLEISSSNFPRFDRNPNTGRLSADSAELVPARQTIFHDSERPSWVVLPVVP